MNRSHLGPGLKFKNFFGIFVSVEIFVKYCILGSILNCTAQKNAAELCNKMFPRHWNNIGKYVFQPAVKVYCSVKIFLKSDFFTFISIFFLKKSEEKSPLTLLYIKVYRVHCAMYDKRKKLQINHKPDKQVEKITEEWWEHCSWIYSNTSTKSQGKIWHK